ncbi:hypothetical protein BpHYR1_052871 [Brachionus plicatilis]|uniref:Uncharacterized protein n=1 Tax=Brachionus plicatilis TaxID=10195 RepID=A0A3M7RJH3_BRAPC|nr:hypothetical protein BpHYR1_052871 [Brachionus plicatilis]
MAKIFQNGSEASDKFGGMDSGGRGSLETSKIIAPNRIMAGGRPDLERTWPLDSRGFFFFFLFNDRIRRDYWNDKFKYQKDP